MEDNVKQQARVENHNCIWVLHSLSVSTVVNLIMMTSSNGNIFRVTGPLCGEFTGPRWIPVQRPVTRSFDVFFDLRLNKRLSKQSWGWRFETLPRPLWRHSNVVWLPGVAISSSNMTLFCHWNAAISVTSHLLITLSGARRVSKDRDT